MTFIDSASLRCSTGSVVGSPGLCWLMPQRSSAAPSLAPLALSASLAAPQFSAASGGAPLASAHSTLSPSCLRDPVWLRSPPRFRPLPDGPPLAFSHHYRTLSHYLLFCILLRFRLTLLSIVGPPLALPMVVGQPRTLTLFLRPPLALLLLRIHPLDLGFLLRLRSLVRCRSLRGPQSVALLLLECSAVRLAAIPYPVSLGFSSFDARMYVRAAA